MELELYRRDQTPSIPLINSHKGVATAPNADATALFDTTIVPLAKVPVEVEPVAMASAVTAPSDSHVDEANTAGALTDPQDNTDPVIVAGATTATGTDDEVVSPEDAGLMIDAAKADRKRPGGVQTYEERLASSYGPFPTPSTAEQHATYERWRYNAYPDYSVIDRRTYAKYNEDLHHRLQVGDSIAYCDIMGTWQKAFIYDFARDEIMIGPLQINSIEFSKDKPGRGIVRIHEGQTRKTTDPDDCWAKRNPQETRRMTAAWLKNNRDFQEKQRVANEVNGDDAYTHQLVTPEARFIPGGDFSEDPDWRCLRNLPPSPLINTVRDHVQPLDSSGIRPCFICHELVKPHPEQPEWTEVGTSFYCHGRRGAVTALERLMKHCELRHNKDTFHFLHIASLDEMAKEPYTVHLHVQRALRKATEQIGTWGTKLHYRLFLTALKYNDPVPLKYALASLFGLAYGQTGVPCDIKSISKYKKYRLAACQEFLEVAIKTLSEIHQAFMEFDFRPLVRPTNNWSEYNDGNDIDVFQIWNATNLFFRRGLFNDRAFPAIWNVTIPDKTLEQYELEEVEVNPKPPAKKSKAETTETRKAALAAIKKRKLATKTKTAHEKASKKEKKEKAIKEDQLPEGAKLTDAESTEI
jgi:hypothetical protein